MVCVSEVMGLTSWKSKCTSPALGSRSVWTGARSLGSNSAFARNSQCDFETVLYPCP